MTGRSILAVAVGGMLGAALRLAIDALLPHGPSDFPLSTLLINLAGSFALGLLVARVWPVAPEWVRAGLGAGLVGTFTTFSALAVSLVALGFSWIALAYLVLSVGGGLAAALLGLRIGRRA